MDIEQNKSACVMQAVNMTQFMLYIFSMLLIFISFYYIMKKK